MGGNLPLGYDLPKAGTRVLEVNEAEAATVRQIFTRYLELGSVHALERELAQQGVSSKQWVTAKGRHVGGAPFSRGALFHLLRNPVYLGKIRHKSEVHEGEHEAIVDASLFNRVQQHLDANARRHRAKDDQRKVKAPLTGKLFDAAGEPMNPTTSHGKAGRKYRYYVSASLQQGRSFDDDQLRRLSAPEIERIVFEALERWLPLAGDRQLHLARVRLRQDGLVFDLNEVLSADLALQLSGEEQLLQHTRDSATIFVPLVLPLRGGQQLVVRGAPQSQRPDPTLVAALRRAHAMLDTERGLPTMKAAPTSPYDRMILRLAFLAPEIQRDIIRGFQPRRFNFEAFKAIDVPLAWSKQRAALEWDQVTAPCSAEKTP